MTFFSVTWKNFISKSLIKFYIFLDFEKLSNGEIGKGNSKMTKNDVFLAHLCNFCLKILNKTLYIF